MSEPLSSGQIVTREEFLELKSSIDTLLQKLNSQAAAHTFSSPQTDNGEDMDNSIVVLSPSDVEGAGISHFQLSTVIERLDTIQNCLEQQNRKQTLLDEKLGGVTSTLEEEKTFMRDQLKGAQDEIKDRLAKLQEQQSIPASADVSSSWDVAGMSESIEKRLEEILDKFQNELKEVPTKSSAQPAKPLPESSEFLGKIQEAIAAELGQMTEKVQNSAQAATKNELLWLNNQVEEKLTEFSETVNKKLQELKENLGALAVEGRQMGGAHEGGDGGVMMREFKEQLEHQIRQASGTLTQGIERSRNAIDNTLTENNNNVMEEIRKERQRCSEEVKQEIRDSVDKTEKSLENVKAAIANQPRARVVGGGSSLWTILLQIVPIVLIGLAMWYLGSYGSKIASDVVATTKEEAQKIIKTIEEYGIPDSIRNINKMYSEDS